MGTGRRLGVILHRKHRTISTGQSFDRVIVQTQMYHEDVTERRIDDGRSFRHRTDRVAYLYRKIVVLRRDLNSSGAEVHDWMIRPMMAELQLIGLESQRETENLMPSTNTKNRTAANE